MLQECSLLIALRPGFTQILQIQRKRKINPLRGRSDFIYMRRHFDTTVSKNIECEVSAGGAFTFRSFCVFTSVFQHGSLLLLHINNYDASPNCIGILMPPVNGSMWHKSSYLTAPTWKHMEPEHPSFRSLCCRTWAKRGKNSTSMYANQAYFCTSCVIPSPPHPLQPSSTSAWPVQAGRCVGPRFKASQLCF